VTPRFPTISYALHNDNMASSRQTHLTSRVTTTSRDWIRIFSVTAAEIACIFGTLVGVGVFGTRVEESSGGALAADATLLAPAGPAFSIWSVIYVGLAAYTLLQWSPTRRADTHYRKTGWLAAISMLLNAAWLLVTQQGWIWVSVGVIFGLVLTLGFLVKRLDTLGVPANVVDRVGISGTFGLYLGWVAVATCANVTAALVSSGVTPTAPTADIIAVLVIGVAVGVVALIFRQTGQRISVAAASAWGLGWIAIGRLTDAPESVVVGVAATIAAVVVLVLATRPNAMAGKVA
jgi:hypothetical protein